MRMTRDAWPRARRCAQVRVEPPYDVGNAIGQDATSLTHVRKVVRAFPCVLLSACKQYCGKCWPVPCPVEGAVPRTSEQARIIMYSAACKVGGETHHAALLCRPWLFW